MARSQAYDAFMATRPSFQQVADKVREQRDVVDKQLTWARLKYLHVDYNPYVFLKSVATKYQFGNVVLDEDLKVRYGWVRWQEIRKRIDDVDSWLQSPATGTANSTLRQIMVEIPDSIDFELDALERNRTLAIQKISQAGKAVVNTATDAVSGIALPVALVVLAGTAYQWQKNKGRS